MAHAGRRTLTAQAPTYFLTRALFLRGLAVVYLIAFVSLWMQWEGLIGSNGILPVRELLQSASDRLGAERYRWLPSLVWLNPGDEFLHALCAGGVLLSVLLFCRLAPVPALLGLWLLYLSLVNVGQEFLSFQWDVLLLEVGFLAIFLAPLGFKPARMRETAPSRLVLWLFHWLLFRLMFSSGVVKLSSQDPIWWKLTALLFHYETQPLPHALGWYAHQLPAWFQRFSCFVMFAIELAVPFLIFAPRRLKQIGCGALLFLQILIVLTGNYCFFNLLTMLLCLTLLDDATLHRLGFSRAPRPPSPQVVGSGRSQVVGWPRWILVPLAAFVVMLSVYPLAGVFRLRLPWPKSFVRVVSALAPFHLVNGYGLFAVMTTVRNEIVVEGSQDGERWLAYEFKFKPGNPDRAPRWVAPHQPRLDWQMWFAALSAYERNPWFIRFCQRLLEGSPEVLALLEKNPFPDAPPRYLRSVFYRYRFTDWSERRQTGRWWNRASLGLYCPVLSLSRIRASATTQPSPSG